jgi:hypothetical protein
MSADIAMGSRSFKQWISEEVSRNKVTRAQMSAGLYELIKLLLVLLVRGGGLFLSLAALIFSFSFIGRFLEKWFPFGFVLAFVSLVLSVALVMVLAFCIAYSYRELQKIPQRIRNSKQRRVCILAFFAGMTIAIPSAIFSSSIATNTGLILATLGAMGALAWDSTFKRLIRGIGWVISWVNGEK